MAASALRNLAVGLLVIAVLAAGCAAPAPTPRTVGLHIENRLANVVLYSVGVHWIGSPPPLSTYTQVVPACGGRLDANIEAASGDQRTLVFLNTDPSGEFDSELALAANKLDDVPVAALQKALIFWSRGNIDVESWITISADEVLLSTVAPAAPTAGGCSPWSYTPEPS
jgi:hypothetical protein